jgi:hypothetical protein
LGSHVPIDDGAAPDVALMATCAETTAFLLVEANEVIEKLRTGRILGAAVLEPEIFDMITSRQLKLQ